MCKVISLSVFPAQCSDPLRSHSSANLPAAVCYCQWAANCACQHPHPSWNMATHIQLCIYVYFNYKVTLSDFSIPACLRWNSRVVKHDEASTCKALEVTLSQKQDASVHALNMADVLSQVHLERGVTPHRGPKKGACMSLGWEKKKEHKWPNTHTHIYEKL